MSSSADSSQERFSREPPERQGPHRSPVFKASRAEAIKPGLQQSVCDSMDKVVSNAYEIVDEHIRQGRDSAARQPHNHNRSTNMNYNPYNPTGTQPNTGVPPNAYMQPWFQAMQTWTNMWMSMLPGMSGGMMPPGMTPGGFPGSGWCPPPNYQANPCYPPPSNAIDSATNLSVSVSSERPVEVIANVAAHNRDAKLTIDPLHLDGKSKAPAITVSMCRDEAGRLEIQVTPVPNQPPGRYYGVVKIEEVVIGDMTVNIRE